LTIFIERSASIDARTITNVIDIRRVVDQFSELTKKDDALSVEMKSPQLDPDSPYGRTVLVVDDEPSILRYIEQALKMAKYKVRTADSEEQALAILHGQQIDLVLTDIVMGESDGFHLAARIDECNSGLPVLFMTGAIPETDQQAQELCEAGLLLRKPFGPQKLWNFLAAALSKRFTSVS
jgi:CheY-like chemotaxis protein